MINFNYIVEPCYKDNELYMKGKRDKVLEVIKPICEAFKIESYDYVCNDAQERLIIEGTKIGCRSNSIGAIVEELINYIFIYSFAQNRSLGPFNNQTLKYLKQYWIKE